MGSRRRTMLVFAVTGLATGGVLAPLSAQAATPQGATPHAATSAGGPAGVQNGKLYYDWISPDSGATFRTVNGDGTGDTPAPQAFPSIPPLVSWSPDGSQVAYSFPDEVWVNDSAFSSPTRIAADTRGVQVTQPRWVDNSHLAFLQHDAAYTGVPGAAILTVAADGTDMHRVPIPATLATNYTNDCDYGVLAGGGFVFYTQGASGLELDSWYPGQASVTKLMDGFSSDSLSVSRDGTKIAVTAAVIGSNPPQWSLRIIDAATRTVTPVATGVANEVPVWAPDGSEIAYSVKDGDTGQDHLVVRELASGTTTDIRPPATGVYERSFALGWQPVISSPPAGEPLQADRAAGADRVGTAVQTSRLGFAGHGAGGRQAQAAVLSRSDTYADALAGSALAAHKQGPLLLTPTDGLDPAVAAELTRTLAPHADVYLLGGTGALSDAVFDQVAQLGFTPVRVWGADRDATAVAIAKEITPTPHTFLVATGLNFPDALAAGAAAGAQPDAVVLLSDDGALSAGTRDYLTANRHDGDKLLGVGVQGSNALLSAFSAGQITLQIRGGDRYETAADLARFWYSGSSAPQTVGVAIGSNWPDALGGGALLGAHPGPLLLSTAIGLPGDEASYLSENSSGLREIVLFGGTAVLPPAAETSIADSVAGAGKWDAHVNRLAPPLP